MKASFLPAGNAAQRQNPDYGIPRDSSLVPAISLLSIDDTLSA